MLLCDVEAFRKSFFFFDIANLKNFFRFKVFINKRVINNKKQSINNFVKTF